VLRADVKEGVDKMTLLKETGMARMTGITIAFLLAACSQTTPGKATEAVPARATEAAKEQAMPVPESPATPAKDPFLEEELKISPDLSIEKVVIPPRGIPAYVVMMRAKATDRKPAVVLLHGGEAGESDKRQTFGLEWPGLHWPQELARMGYCVVCTDGWACGEHPGVAEAQAMQKPSLFDKLIPRLAETAKDSSSVCDYLAARPDVDPGRIALMGISAGAMATFVAAMTEDRFATYVAVNGGCDFLNSAWTKKLFYMLKGIGSIEQIPAEVQERIRSIDPMYHVDKIAPKPLLMVHGQHDQLAVPMFTQGLYEKLVPLYKDHPDRLERKEFDAFPPPTNRSPDITEILLTHVPTPGMTQYVYDWLDKWTKNRVE
jgi:dienelactone hydrolase